MTAQIIEKGYISRQFFNNGLALLTGLLISAPGPPAESEAPGAQINRHVAFIIL